MTGAGSGAGHASGTPLLIKEKLFAEMLAFRVVAPETMQRTAFKKDSGPDAFSIMNGEFLYVEKCRSLHGWNVPFYR